MGGLNLGGGSGGGGLKMGGSGLSDRIKRKLGM